MAISLIVARLRRFNLKHRRNFPTLIYDIGNFDKIPPELSEGLGESLGWHIASSAVIRNSDRLFSSAHLFAFPILVTISSATSDQSETSIMIAYYLCLLPPPPPHIGRDA
jgi:hypothetical protein